MATQRKSATRKAAPRKVARPAKAAKKPAPPAKPAHKPGKGAPARAGRSAKPAPTKAAAGKPGAKSKPAQPVAKGKMAKPPAPVQPLGVLPPESMARGSGRPARPAVPPPRPARPAERVAAGNPGKPVTANDYEEFEQRLLAERARVMKEMGYYESTVLKVNQRDSAGDLSGYSFHMADVGTDAMEREKAFQLASAEGRILLEINEALRRIARGEYGVCESCGKPILRARLEAMPTARLCLSCKEKEERAARGLA
jgi:RNA polymerase-binding protein DksA